MNIKLAALIVVTGLVVIGAMPQAWGSAQLDARINPNSATSPFDIKYQRTILIEYPEEGGELEDRLRNISQPIEFELFDGDPEVEILKEQLNRALLGFESISSVDDLNVDYIVRFNDNEKELSIDYNIELYGTIQNYVITRDEAIEKTIIDATWREFTINEPVYLQGIEINHPIGVISHLDDTVASAITGEAREILERPLIDATGVADQPLGTWHFLFDPTGINVDASLYGLSDEIAGFVESKYTMGESSIREGIKIEQKAEATFVADREYVVKTFESSDSAQIAIIGQAKWDSLDGYEIFGVTPGSLEGYQQDVTGGFPVFIIYGMAGLAAVGGVAFFVFSNRALKKEEGMGQQGIDPSRLTAYQTSSSSGGYQTNRAEAQLTDSGDYQQHRSVYDEGDTQRDDETPTRSRGTLPKGW